MNVSGPFTQFAEREPQHGEKSAAARAGSALGAVLGVFGRAQTWVNLVYLWAAAPLGLFYFILLVVGLSLGVGLLIIWVGLVFLIVTLLLAWGGVQAERWQARVLLGARLGPARRRRDTAHEGETVSGWTRSVASSPALWKGLVFLCLKFPLGLLGWVVSVVGLTTSIALLVVPFVAGNAIWIDDVRLGWGGEPWELGVLFVAGFLMLLATLHVQNLFAALWRELASLLLTVREGDALPPAETTMTPGDVGGPRPASPEPASREALAASLPALPMAMS